MSLDELEKQLDRNRQALGDSVELPLDGQTRDELAFLSAVLGSDAGEILRRSVHEQLRVLLGNQILDAHLRQRYDVTYDEYLVGQEFDDVDDVGGVERSGDRGFL